MKSCGTTQNLGTFTQGEVPAPLVYQYLDADGVPINLTGYQVRFVWKPAGGLPVTGNGSIVDAATGQVGYSWSGAEFNIPGPYEAQFWAGNLTNKFASDVIQWTVRVSVGPVPAI